MSVVQLFCSSVVERRGDAAGRERAGQKLWSSKERQQCRRAAVTRVSELETACSDVEGMYDVLGGSNGAEVEDLAAALKMLEASSLRYR
jgi:hypothetical protein